MPWDHGPGLRCPGALVPGIPSKLSTVDGTPVSSGRVAFTITKPRPCISNEALFTQTAAKERKFNTKLMILLQPNKKSESQ